MNMKSRRPFQEQRRGPWDRRDGGGLPVEDMCSRIGSRLNDSAHTSVLALFMPVPCLDIACLGAPLSCSSRTIQPTCRPCAVCMLNALHAMLIKPPWTHFISWFNQNSDPA